jgi:ABC-type amino acid transport substrate-binding protein
VNAASAAMYEDGTIASLQEKYFGEVLETPAS